MRRPILNIAAKEKRSINLLDSLVVHLSRLDVCGHRAGKVTKLSNVGSGGDIDTLCVVVQGGISGGERWRETVVHCGIDELGAL